MLPEVHRLASRYHWSEQEIFSLPLVRRAAYLALIDAEQDARIFAALEEK